MGKSGKLFKSLVAGVRSFKSPSKERPVKDDKDHARKKSKEKCFGSLGKSSSRNRELVAVTTASPEAIEIKCVQVESEKLKDVLPVPVAELYSMEQCSKSDSPPRNQAELLHGNQLIQLSPPASKECNGVSDREEWAALKEGNGVSDREVRAASKIQAAFRCYLAQQAFRALRALVHLQALARGWLVRRQAAASLRCLNALIRVQAHVRGCRVRNSELGQLVHKHLQQTNHSRKRPSEGWVNSVATAQQWHAKVQVKQDAVTNRQRMLVYTLSEQLSRRSQKQSSSLGSGSQIDESHWIWEWLEIWTASNFKGGSPTVPAEGCSPTTKSLETAKMNTKGSKQADNPRKERRKWGEHVNNVSPLPQREWDLVSEVHEGSSMEVMREEEMKVCQDLKALVAGESSSVPSTVQKVANSSLATLCTPPVSPLKEGNDAPVVSDMGSQQVHFSASDLSPEIESSLPSYAAGALTTMHFTILGSEAFPSAVDCTHLPVVAETASSTDDRAALSSPELTCQAPSIANGHLVCDSIETLHMGLDSPPNESNRTFSSVSPSLPHYDDPSSDFMTLSVGEDMKSPSQTHAFSTQESTGEKVSNGVYQPGEIMEDLDYTPYVSKEAMQSISEDERRIIDEPDHSIQADARRDPSEPGSGLTESLDFKHDGSIQGETMSEGKGGCDASVVSVDVPSIEVSSKSLNRLGSKHEQSESDSPRLPSYMATTKSSKAKVRALTSPKQKLDSMKPKQESPKPKMDSPKMKVDLPTPKVDSASKRRQSLSALDGKVSLGNPKPAFHVRAGSKSNFSSMKDLSSDNLSRSNGHSRQHVK